MSAANKIDKLELGDRVLELSSEGETSQSIADIVTAEMTTGKISQPTVSRYLKKVRVKRAAVALSVMQGFVQMELPADLAILSDIKRDYVSLRKSVFDRFTGAVAAEILPGGVEPIPATLKNIMLLDAALHEFIKTTLRFVGVASEMPGLEEALKAAEENMGVIPSLDGVKAA